MYELDSELDSDFEQDTAPEHLEQLATLSALGLGLGGLVIVLGRLLRRAGASLYWVALGVAGPAITLALWLRRRLRLFERSARRAGAIAERARRNVR